jgi:uncharacterized protein
MKGIKHRQIYPISKLDLFDLITKKESFIRFWSEELDTAFFYREPILQQGSKTILQLNVGPLKMKHSFYCTEIKEGELIVIKQGAGLFKSLTITTNIIPTGKNSCELLELVEYCLPTIPLLNRLLNHSIHKRINQFLMKKSKRLKKDLYYMNRYPIKGERIAISGCAGLVGSRLKSFLEMLGVEVFILKRTKSEHPNEIFYDYNTGTIENEKLEGLSAVIHLAGEPITLNPSKKKLLEIKHSRSASTELIARGINQCKTPPKSFLVASACGIYSSSKTTLQDEESPYGDSILSEICKKWEAAAQTCTKSRVVSLRFSPILSSCKGLLKKMSPIAKMGMMPIFGGGQQYTSWISIDDALYQILHILKTKNLNGPVNICTPHYITQERIAKTLCNTLRRPQFIRLPEIIFKSVLPSFTTELLFSSQKIAPTKLIDSGAQFAYPHIKEAMEQIY